MPRKKKPSNGEEDGADDAQKLYMCKCIKYCDGDPTPLSKSSYYRHRLVEKLRRAGKHVADKVRRKRKKDSVGRGARRRGGTQDPAERALGDVYDPQEPQRFPSPEPMMVDIDPFADPPRSPSPNPPLRPRATVEDAVDEDDEDDDPAAAGAIEEEVEVMMEDIKNALTFINLLKGATLDDPKYSGLGEETITRLQNPPQELLEINKPDELLSIKIFLALHNTADECYEKVRLAIMQDNDKKKLLSLYQVKRLVEILSGVIPIVNDMCIQSCVGYTGAYADLIKCPKCDEPRYDELHARKKNGSKKVARQQFYTMPLGPQLQPLYRTPEGAQSMDYLSAAVDEVLQELEETDALKDFKDVSHGSQFWGAYSAGKISKDDIVVMLSIDGAQLYRNKKSDCWIYIWVVLNLSPDKRYRRKYVLPGAVIPGPNHPKDLDSFLFPGLYHVSALMNEGLSIWHAQRNTVMLVYIFLALVLGDSPAMALLSGMVGLTGRRGCRLYCPLLGRRKDRAGTYYPMLLKPALPYAVPACSHDDVDPSTLSLDPVQRAVEYRTNRNVLMASRTKAEYERNRKETGLTKPSIFSGLSRMFELPACFPLDYMHLVALNITDCFLSMWRGTITGEKGDAAAHPWAVFDDDVSWKAHGREVARAAPFLPGSFDRPPRNIAERISSGYKAKEWMTYFYGYGPEMLRQRIPDAYYRNYCKFVWCGRVMGGHSIEAAELARTDALAHEAQIEFEVLYVNRNPDLLHHIRPCIHAFGHAARHVRLSGPLLGHTQYTMERHIGDIGGQVRLPSNPYANLSRRAMLRSQLNALKAMYPALEDNDPNRLPRGALDVGNGFVLLRARDGCARWLPALEADAFGRYLANLAPNAQGPVNPPIRVMKWARARLPNRQVTRSAWKEILKPLAEIRIARIVKILHHGQLKIAEVRYYCRLPAHGPRGTPRTVALVSLFGARNEARYTASYQTNWVAPYRGDDDLHVIDITCIQSVVGMVPTADVHVNIDSIAEPHFKKGGTYFLVEKLGLEGSYRSGALDAIVEEEE
ncbi:hypothetical protein TRAPUB_10052 [Trametes pubescens]|uniref:Uncharacterized protein n=1 Tax=Trametes pubescens TaxID=154538 RepID=A0A1M2W0M8_TRAPU|nr:hypothetical protein TRAPUB_2201 [Trametes pubescens]OJT07126.1 hypothetical protein TRAPUB_2017 [Trametes pubescens]OJT10778.1 hypothetical protein TRAPUB_12720 [Trametes pubescens]OJT13417.1 hypothetical protein TRAPUB_10052 [Trametes pubescens]